jgi:hypothetical protein
LYAYANFMIVALDPAERLWNIGANFIYQKLLFQWRKWSGSQIHAEAFLKFVLSISWTTRCFKMFCEKGKRIHWSGWGLSWSSSIRVS